MSLTGKNTISLRKKDVLEQKQAGAAYKRLVFAHKATLGDTGINVTSLTQPSEMASLGFTNPSTAEILAGKMLFHKKNLTVVSSSKGVLIQDLSYTVPTNERIAFQDFTAEDGEIFTCILESSVRDGLQVVDAISITSDGELDIGETDYNVGTPFEVGKNISFQVGSVLVFRDGVLQKRNPANGTSGGNYQEVDAGGGLGSIIRFNDAPVSEASDIVVVSNGMVAERPTGSVMAVVETLAGQVDAMIPTLADLAGVDETDFQAAPNNVDLKNFGDTVQDHEERISDLETPVENEIWLQDLASGSDFGSSGTRIRRFDTVRKNLGTAMTLTQSSLNGDSVTINEKGIYSIIFIAQFTAAIDFGITLNASSISTDITSLVDEQIIAITEGGGADFPSTASVTLWLNPSDIVRPQVDSGTLSYTKNGVHQFRIVKVK